MKTRPISCGPAVNESEHQAFEHVRSRLDSEPGDGEWFLLTNLAFSATDQIQSDEIDMVAIGPPGVRVIEVKHWTASWVDRHPEEVRREAERVTNKARKIGTTLRRKIASLGRVDGVFLITQEAPKVKRLDGQIERGVPFHTLKTWRQAVGADLPAVLSAGQVRLLSSVLEPKSLAVVDGGLRRLAGYVRLELQTPREERFHRVYKGTHATRQDRVILHLYDLSANQDPKAETKARREFEALFRLQLFPWAPRILDSFQETPGYPGESAFFTIVDPIAPCIDERARDVSWDEKARLAFARKAVRALKQLHAASGLDEPIVHRNLGPKTILVRHDNSPILTGFEYARIPADATVASAIPGGAWEATAAPEVRAQGLGAADHRSDVYSLCTSLSVLFAERDDETSRSVVESLDEGMAEVPEARETLENLEASLSALMGEPAPPPPLPPARFWTEDQIVPFRGHKYRIVTRLGSGSVGTTFKVIKIDSSTGDELGTYVGKVAHDPDIGARVTKSYELAHSHLHHSALSTIFEVNPEWEENNFVALMRWVEGSALHDYTGVFPLLAEDQQDESPEALALRWLQTACEALGVLHRNGLVHGDVSPRNMIVSNGDLVLTDYDCVSRVGQHAVAPGTILYCSPSFLENHPASPADDIYALAASFFHVVFEREPFRYDGDLAKDRGLHWTGEDHAEYPVLAAFLDRATSRDPEKRFATVAEAIAALTGIPAVETRGHAVGAGAGEATPDTGYSNPNPTQPSEMYENEVSWLKSLLQSYPGSLWGNQETRGLDSEFAEDTYIETHLEREIHRDIIERRARLVVLCGNAGDGKTALLQHLGQRLGLGQHRSASRIVEGQTTDGLTVHMNLDGSASLDERSADQLLDEFMEPFLEGQPPEDVVHLLAINDGRLLEWIEGFEQRHGTATLTKNLSAFLEGQGPGDESHIRFIDLNHRSLVGGVTADSNTLDTSFLDDLVNSLYGADKAQDIWSPCHSCSAQERCEVFRATRIFGPDSLPTPAASKVRSRARERLFEALQAVHLRGETHITIRELRATLVYILFGIHFCSDYHAGVAAPDVSPPETYADRAFSPVSPGRQGDVLRELVRLDPALEAHPQIDRYLRQPASIDLNENAPRYAELSLDSARRRAYFEWTEDEFERLTRDRHAIGLAKGRHLREFRDLALKNSHHENVDLIERLCRGIARLETLPPQALDRPGKIPLRIRPRTPTETAFWAEKELRDFRVAVGLPGGGEGMDRLHRHVLLTYCPRGRRKESLRVGAELFHLLLELSNGYQLGDVSTDDTFAHLSIFVQRLVREDSRRLLAWNPMDEETIYEVSARIDGQGSEPQRLAIAPLKPGTPNGE